MAGSNEGITHSEGGCQVSNQRTEEIRSSDRRSSFGDGPKHRLCVLPLCCFLLHLFVQPSVLQRDCSLGRKDAHDLDAFRREGVCCQIVLEIKDPTKLSLMNHWNTKNGPWLDIQNVGITQKALVGRSIVHDDA